MLGIQRSEEFLMLAPQIERMIHRARIIQRIGHKSWIVFKVRSIIFIRLNTPVPPILLFPLYVPYNAEHPSITRACFFV